MIAENIFKAFATTAITLFFLIKITALIFTVLAIYKILTSKDPKVTGLGWILSLIQQSFVTTITFFFLRIRSNLNKETKHLIELTEKNKEIKEQLKEELKHIGYTKPEELGIDDNITFLNNHQFVGKLIEEIEKAKKYIVISTYIFEGETALKLIDALTLATKRGVETTVIIDNGGSGHFIKEKNLKEFAKTSSFELLFYNTTLIRKNFRSHSKTILIDGKIGFIGSHNLRDFASPMENKKPTPIDGNASISFSGEILKTLSKYTTMLYHETSGKVKLFPVETTKSGNKKTEKDYARIFYNGYNNSIDAMASHLFIFMLQAKKSIKILNPYIFAPEKMLFAIDTLIKRGVSVEIVTPEPKFQDGKPSQYATPVYIAKFINMGVDIYLTQYFVHSKYFIVDDEIMLIGSCNMDYRSLSINKEIMIETNNKAVVKELIKSYEFTKSNSILHKAYGNSYIITKFELIRSNFFALFAFIF